MFGCQIHILKWHKEHLTFLIWQINPYLQKRNNQHLTNRGCSQQAGLNILNEFGVKHTQGRSDDVHTPLQQDAKDLVDNDHNDREVVGSQDDVGDGSREVADIDGGDGSAAVHDNRGVAYANGGVVLAGANDEVVQATVARQHTEEAQPCQA